jgi:hypothetical protein
VLRLAPAGDRQPHSAAAAASAIAMRLPDMRRADGIVSGDGRRAVVASQCAAASVCYLLAARQRAPAEGGSVRRTWTIIGVEDVAASFKWYQSLLGLPESAPAHDYFGQIVDADGTVLLCLHEWGEHDHP